MYISYKFFYVSKDNDSGLITEAAVRFYEGEDQEVEVTDPVTNEVTTVTQYVRVNRLGHTDVPEIGGTWRTDGDNQPISVFTPAQFGEISDEDELRLFLNQEMAKHETRPNAPPQDEVTDVTKVL
jgi:hypothetical protein